MGFVRSRRQDACEGSGAGRRPAYERAAIGALERRKVLAPLLRDRWNGRFGHGSGESSSRFTPGREEPDAEYAVCFDESDRAKRTRSENPARPIEKAASNPKIPTSPRFAGERIPGPPDDLRREKTKAKSVYFPAHAPRDVCIAARFRERPVCQADRMRPGLLPGGGWIHDGRLPDERIRLGSVPVSGVLAGGSVHGGRLHATRHPSLLDRGNRAPPVRDERVVRVGSPAICRARAAHPATPRLTPLPHREPAESLRPARRAFHRDRERHVLSDRGA